MAYRDDLREAILGAPVGKGGDARRRAAKADPPSREDRSRRFQPGAAWASCSRENIALADPQPETPRVERARRRLRAEYAPLGILGRIVFAPVVAGTVALSLYIAGSPFRPDQALAHLVAMGGCESAAVVGLVPAQAGSPGYHRPLDVDGNGVACTPEDIALSGGHLPGAGGSVQAETGAKFVRP